VKLIIISDLHANLESLTSLPQDYDYLLCAGDLVDYGPDPKECIAWVRRRAHVVVCGNHDRAVGYRIDCGCSYVMKELSLATRQLVLNTLDVSEINYLRELPLERELTLGGCSFYLTHAVPGDLYRYLDANVSDEELRELVAATSARVIIWGHTHKPWIRKLDDRLIVNPGSIGQPRDGNPQASYAVWEDGELKIIRKNYNYQDTIHKINHLALEPRYKNQLGNILKSGGSLNVS
jgi:putative phosphoesterase